MATYCGRLGYVKAGAAGSEAVVGEMSSWTLTVDSPATDISVFQNSGWSSFKGCGRSWSGSAEGFFDTADTAQLAIWTAITGETALGVYFHVDDTIRFSGSCHPTSWSANASVGGISTASFNFQGTDTLTRTAA